ncbi:MAG: hypothetical protein QGG50_05445 [Methanopyri archaeon]|nr:hypothetical protein [Methanopyri archaeon]
MTPGAETGAGCRGQNTAMGTPPGFSYPQPTYYGNNLAQQRSEQVTWSPPEEEERGGWSAGKVLMLLIILVGIAGLLVWRSGLVPTPSSSRGQSSTAEGAHAIEATLNKNSFAIGDPVVMQGMRIGATPGEEETIRSMCEWRDLERGTSESTDAAVDDFGMFYHRFTPRHVGQYEVGLYVGGSVTPQTTLTFTVT